MLLGATYAVAHDHEEHNVEFEAEGILCSGSAFTAAKVSPDTASIATPEFIDVGQIAIASIQVVDRFNANPRLARGPPLSFHSS